jgi:phosphohistidine swiveling domain-containing protein
MPRHVLSLDDEAARDPTVSGSKAAMLGRARAIGSPVLPGWVVPVGEASSSVAIGADLIQQGAHEACAAMSTLGLDHELVDELGRAWSGVASCIVRSSGVHEGDRRWAGGFATYHDIPPDGLPNAVRACWASAFTREAVRRREELGERAGDVRIAVLIQPWISFDLGGVARLTESGNVALGWVPGGPAGLMGGRRSGDMIEIDGRGEPIGELPDGLAPLFAKVANLVRGMADAQLGDSIEWGARGGDVFLLQVDRSHRPAAKHVAVGREANRAVEGSSVARRIALAASLFPGPLGEDVILPWAAAPGADLAATPCRLSDPVGALREALMLGERLAGEAWGGWRTSIAGEVAATFRGLLGPAPEAAIERLGRLRPVDPMLGRRAISLMRAIAHRLVGEGVLRSEREIWRLSPSACARAVRGSGTVVPPPLGPSRWEPFLFDVAHANGVLVQGTPISPAIGAGWMFVPDRAHRERIGPRQILVLRDPVPQAAPLLWGSAGLVTANGSLGAHLFEVARSLGVPAVTGIDLTGSPECTMIALDGHSGRVSSWTAPQIVGTTVQGPLSA